MDRTTTSTLSYTAQATPRLRLSRRAILPSDSSSTTSAEPPRAQDGHTEGSDDETNSNSTPRQRSSPQTTRTLSPQNDTPATRLRALNARLQDISESNSPSSSLRLPPAPSEHESDFEAPYATAPPSDHRQSLRRLFENAVRDSPQKDKEKNFARRPRGASFGAEDSPRVAKERRKSLSDEEREPGGVSSESLHFSRSASFDLLHGSLPSFGAGPSTSAAPEPVLPPSPESPTPARPPSAMSMSTIDTPRAVRPPARQSSSDESILPPELTTPRPAHARSALAIAQAKTPKLNGISTHLASKTPRLPGAWETPRPAPAYVDNPSPPQRMSTPSNPRRTPEIETPAPSQPPETPMTLPPQTPALPGAWAITPAPRKGILKVRFHETTKPAPPSPPAAPTPARSPGVRLLDAFGRERKFTETGEEIALEPPGSERKVRPVDVRPIVPASPSPSPSPVLREREKAKIKEEEGHRDRERTQRSAATKKRYGELRHAVSEAHALAEDEDRRLNTQLSTPSDSSTETPRRLHDLAERSRRARQQRGTIARRVENIVNGAARLAERLTTLRRGGPRAAAALSKGTSWTTVFIFLFLQLLLVLVMFHIAHLRAHWLVINAYFDPNWPSILRTAQSVHAYADADKRWPFFAVVEPSHGRDSFLGYVLQAVWEAWEASRPALFPLPPRVRTPT